MLKFNLPLPSAANEGKRALRPTLLWPLALTLLAVAWALWWPQPPVPVETPPIATKAATQASSKPWTLPERPAWTAAGFDPFEGMPVAPLARPAEAQPPDVSPSAPALAPPAAPPLSYRYLGRMQAPGGQVQVYLARGERELSVSVGTVLEEGYVVEAISDDAVLLRYPPLNQVARIPIAPREEQ